MKRLLMFAMLLSTLFSHVVPAQNWVSLNGPGIASGVKDIAIDNSGSTLYVADASFVLKSTNSGTVWSVTALPYSNPFLVLVKPDQANIVLAAKNEELKYNSDGGAGGWTQVIGEQDLVPLRLAAAITDPTVMFLGRTYDGDCAIWRSVNGGSYWASQSNVFHDETDIHDFAPYPNSIDHDGTWAGVVWACGSAPDGMPKGESYSSEAGNAGLWFTVDYGDTWYADRLGNGNLRSVAVVPHDDDNYVRLAAQRLDGNNDVVLRNPYVGGSDWDIVFEDAADVYMIRLKKSNNSVFLATSCGVYRSDDEGENWTLYNDGLGNDTDVLSVAPAADENTVFAGTSHSLYKSTDNGEHWVDVGKMNVSSVEKYGQSVWAVSKDNAFVGRSTDAGSTWNNSYISSPSATMSSTQIYRNPYNNNLFVAGTYSNGGVLYLSTDGGEGFANVYSMSPSGSKLFGTTTDVLLDNDRVYAFGGGTVNSTYRNLFPKHQWWNLRVGRSTDRPGWKHRRLCK